MIYGSVLFAVFLLVVVALKYLAPVRSVCPQCGEGRDDDHPLCTNCGWIFDVEDDDDDDDDEEDIEEDPTPWSS